MIIEEGAATIDDLTGYGVEFDRENGHYQLGKEGGHSKRRILHARDVTGREIERALLAEARRTPNLTVLENHIAVDLITLAKLGYGNRRPLPRRLRPRRSSGEVHALRTDRVVLATGGCGKVYLYTTNPDIATGDGVAMAWRAGATIANMEFIQFHPTCLYHPRGAQSSSSPKRCAAKAACSSTPRARRSWRRYHPPRIARPARHRGPRHRRAR